MQGKLSSFGVDAGTSHPASGQKLPCRGKIPAASFVLTSSVPAAGGDSR